MTTTELIRETQKRLPPYYQHKYKQWELKMVLEKLLEATVEALASGEDVKLHGFGRFSPEARRFCSNLGDGSSHDGIRIAFRPSKNFKKAVKDTIGKGKIR